MQPNNNPFAEISALVLALVLIVAGAVLLFFGKIDTIFAGYFFVSAVGVFGYNAAFKAPSPAQQAALLQLASQVLSTQAQPAPTPAPAPAPVVQLPFNPAASGAATPQANFTTSINPQLVNVPVQQLPFPAAINTTLGSTPVVKP